MNPIAAGLAVMVISNATAFEPFAFDASLSLAAGEPAPDVVPAWLDGTATVASSENAEWLASVDVRVHTGTGGTEHGAALLGVPAAMDVLAADRNTLDFRLPPDALSESGGWRTGPTLGFDFASRARDEARTTAIDATTALIRTGLAIRIPLERKHVTAAWGRVGPTEASRIGVQLGFSSSLSRQGVLSDLRDGDLYVGLSLRLVF